MTVNVQSRPGADLSQYFAPDIIDPLKRSKSVLVWTSYSNETGRKLPNYEYDIAQALDHPVRFHLSEIRLSPVMPRGIPWHDFPIVSDPFYSVPILQPSLASDYRWKEMEKSDLSGLASYAEAMVFVPEEIGWKRTSIIAHELSYLLQKLKSKHAEIHVKTTTGMEVRPTAELGREVATEMRFLYSYRVNFAAIAMKALRELVPPEHENRHEDFYEAFGKLQFCDWRGIRAGIGEPVDHPLALQWLYRLRQIGRFDANYARGEKWAHANHLLSLSNDQPTLWAGTGKYPGVDPRHPVRYAPFKWLSLGLAQYGFDTGEITLTDRGHRFLDRLHPDCEDPDVLLRWVDPETGEFRPGSEKACDDWVLRFFSKMKTKVNLI